MKFIVLIATFVTATAMASPAVATAGSAHTQTAWKNHLGLSLSVIRGDFRRNEELAIPLRLVNARQSAVEFWKSPSDPSNIRIQVLDSRGHLLWRWHTSQRVCPDLAVLKRLAPGHTLYRSVRIRLRWSGDIQIEAVAGIPSPLQVSLHTSGMPIHVG